MSFTYIGIFVKPGLKEFRRRAPVQLLRRTDLEIIVIQHDGLVAIKDDLIFSLIIIRLLLQAIQLVNVSSAMADPSPFPEDDNYYKHRHRHENL